MRISDWSSYVCSSDLCRRPLEPGLLVAFRRPPPPLRGGLLLFGWRWRIAMREAANRRSRRKGAGEDRQTENRANLYDEVTGRIISELEAGRLPWVQPWGSTGSAGPGLPRNALTARNYSGVNELQSLIRITYAVTCL